MKTVRLMVLLLFASVLLAGCSQAAAATRPPEAAPALTEAGSMAQVTPTEPALPTPSAASGTNAASGTSAAPETAAPQPAQPTGTAAEAPLPTPVPTLAPEAWRSLPVIPDRLDERMLAVYRRGLELGNNPQAFSKIGDCGSTPAWFLGDFDRGPRYYRLGEHQVLLPTIEYYAGSFDRTSLAAKEGFTAASVFTLLWADRSQCAADETPLGCEYRAHRPALAFIMLGTNDVWHADSFEPQMRKIIETSLENGVIPVLSTKADDREGDGRLNAALARLAVEYGLPLWNYWLAVQDLPNGGLQEDGAHITWAPNRFDDPLAMQKGWPVRNLTALQMLDYLRRSLPPQ